MCETFVEIRGGNSLQVPSPPFLILPLALFPSLAALKSRQVLVLVVVEEEEAAAELVEVAVALVVVVVVEVAV